MGCFSKPIGDVVGIFLVLPVCRKESLGVAEAIHYGTRIIQKRYLGEVCGLRSSGMKSDVFAERIG